MKKTRFFLSVALVVVASLVSFNYSPEVGTGDTGFDLAWSYSPSVAFAQRIDGGDGNCCKYPDHYCIGTGDGYYYSSGLCP
jgi:hypothetical protein